MPANGYLPSVPDAPLTRHGEETKIDFDIGDLDQVLAPGNLFSWGYWLKPQCRCIWGNDRAKHFQPFKPSRAIIVAVNGDFDAVLTRYAEMIEHCSNPLDIKR